MVKFERVPEEERVVIYRMGRFARVEGPGFVKLTKGVENIERRIFVRAQSLTFSFGNLFINGTPFGYSLNLWCAYDIQKAAGGNKQQLAEFAQFTDEERHQNARVKIQEGLRESIKAYEEKYPLSPTAKLGEKLSPILPGTRASKEILTDLKTRLKRMLPSIGVILDSTHSINVVGFQVSPQIASGFERSRIVEQLRDQLPDLPPDLFAQLVASIQGLDQLKTEHLHVNQDGGSRPATIDYRTLADGSSQKRIRFTAPGYEDEVANAQSGEQRKDATQESAGKQDADPIEDEENSEDQTHKSPSPNAPPAPPNRGNGYRFTKRDVEMLKQVPRRATG